MASLKLRACLDMNENAWLNLSAAPPLTAIVQELVNTQRDEAS